MTKQPRILVAEEVWQPGLDRICELVGQDNVDIIPPFEDFITLPAEQVRDRTIVFADFPPTNLADMVDLEWVQLGSAGYEQLKGFALR
jgi:hypothetical protein